MARFLSLITLLLFLSPFPTLLAFVVDIEDNPLRNSGSYYIIPKGDGGSLTLAEKSGEPECPNYITQKPSSKGLPVTISSLLRILYIPVSAPVFFAFNTDSSTCTAPQGWRVITDTITSKKYVVTGGLPSTTFPVLFTIEETGSGDKKIAYKIRYCDQEDNCGDVGFFEENGLMGITDENLLLVEFNKVNDNKSGLFQI
ncbi:Trypsin inhibitor BvTI [Bienertia sinuspersici]